VHSPEICLAGSGLVQEGGTALHKENPTPLGTTSSFRKAKFGKPDAAVPAHAWVYWGWNAGDGWQAPEHPRWSFAGAPVVYKLYLVAPDVRADEPTGVDHGQEFLRILLPELAKNLAFKS
jgi:hypothetical protein